MLKKVFLLAVVFGCFSCGGNETTPDYLIDEEKMVQVLIDIRTAEGQVNTMNLSSDSARHLFQYVEKKIFEKHQIDSASYMQSFEYYMLDSEKFLKITDIVIDSLKVRLQKVTAN